MMINGVLFMVLLLPGVLMQSIPTLSTCPTRTVTLPDSRGSYNIQHSSDPVGSDTCELTLKYTSNIGSYALVEGVIKKEGESCPTSQINIGEQNYCIGSDESAAIRAESQHSTLLITTRADESNFTISAYISVYTCDNSANPNSSWSGVVSSRGGGVRIIIQDDCYTVLSDLPSGARVEFKTLSPFIVNDATVSIAGQKVVNVAAAGDAVYMSVADRGTIIIRRTVDDPDDPQLGGFVLVYTVIRCGDIPGIENTTHTPIQPPYLPGSTVQHSCGDNYHFKNRSYITCEEKIQGEAVWSDDVMCIPVPWCLKPPQNISRSTQTNVSVNRTVSYECEEGYESTYGLKITLTCSSTDEDRQPWRWNDTNIETKFICDPVQCEVDAIQDITNGSLDNNTSTNYYKDTITYDCEVGYRKNTTDPIICQSNKFWSAVPGCEQEGAKETEPGGTSKDREGLSEDEKLYIIIAVVVVIVVAIVVVVTFIVLRRGRLATRQGTQGGVVAEVNDTSPDEYEDVSDGPISRRGNSTNVTQSVHEYETPEDRSGYEQITLRDVKETTYINAASGASHGDEHTYARLGPD